jgi:hypothetical protein
VAGLFERIFRLGSRGRARALALARGAELRGELRRAGRLFEQAGRPDEAARVKRTRALALLEATRGMPVTASRRPELAEAAADLESLGDLARAAEAYARAHDLEGEARALARAGEVDQLDRLLDAEQERDREAQARRSGHEEFDMCVASGRRAEALAIAGASTDPSLRARGASLHSRRVAGGIVRLEVRGQAASIVLGNRVVVGRAPDDDDRSVGAVAVSSTAVSRRHLAIERRDGEVRVRDLGSHNGTHLRGAPMQGEAKMGLGIELRLGGEVPLVVRPAEEWPGAVSIEVAGVRYVAPLGDARLGVGAWRLECPDEWVELVTDDAPPAFAGGLRLAPRIALIVGDALATAPNGPPALRLVAPPGTVTWSA